MREDVGPGDSGCQVCRVGKRGHFIPEVSSGNDSPGNNTRVHVECVSDTDDGHAHGGDL